MRPGDLSLGTAKLDKSWSTLRAHWEAVGHQWRDGVSHDFEQQHLRELEAQIHATLERMRALNDVFSAAQQDCRP